eukprot:TRINITY_DN7007_c0_g1_i2.p1 TRINITY_DN7007_c0_g1~~TRINITY_DN7007_c0_g1_i2.p1  ORF type:complete len:182 (+),score=38.87 TRINITY_DN7007_c0_g1_i2:32-547(+)
MGVQNSAKLVATHLATSMGNVLESYSFYERDHGYTSGSLKLNKDSTFELTWTYELNDMDNGSIYARNVFEGTFRQEEEHIGFKTERVHYSTSAGTAAALAGQGTGVVSENSAVQGEALRAKDNPNNFHVPEGSLRIRCIRLQPDGIEIRVPAFRVLGSKLKFFPETRFMRK